MAIQDDLPRALRALRERTGLAQGDLRERGGPPVSTVSKLESAVRPPDFRTVASFLEALELSFHDLADALDSVGGKAPRQRPGAPRAAWVSALRQRGIDSDILFGMAHGGIEPGDAGAEADLVASAEAAARELAVEILDQRRAAEDLPAVAEPTPPYSASPTLRSTSPTSGRGRRGGG